MYINIDFEQLFKRMHSLFDVISDEDRWNHETRDWTRYKPTYAAIDTLFREYECYEFLEEFYDNEPDYDEEEFHMYMDYIEQQKTDDEVTNGGFFEALVAMPQEGEPKKKHFASKAYSLNVLKQAYDKIRKQQEDYEPTRIKVNNWVEIHTEGNWGATQKQVDSLAKQCMIAVKKADKQEGIDNTDRFWIKDAKYVDLNTKEEFKYLLVYYYGRDYKQVDYVWSLYTHDEMKRFKDYLKKR